MTLEQIYTGCLAHGAYYITSNGEAAIIDPLRETKPYLERAAADGVKITYIFETHFHADFVSGHLDLAKATGAKIVYGPTAKPGFEAITAEDGQTLSRGERAVGGAAHARPHHGIDVLPASGRGGYSDLDFHRRYAVHWRR